MSVKALRATARRPWVVLGLVALGLFGAWVYGTRTTEHELVAVFDRAVNLAPGLDVQVAGVDVGKIRRVEYRDGRAVVALGIDDGHWPLRRGTTAKIRYGTTIGNGTRRVDLEPGPDGTPALPEGGIIGQRDTVAGVEFDEVFDMLDRDARAHLKGSMAGVARTLEGRERELRGGLAASAEGLAGTGGVLADLAADERALRALIVNTARATRVLGTRRDALTATLRSAGTTFDAFARNSNAVERSLVQLRPALDDGRGLLARLDESVEHLDALVADVRPGARRLASLARVATPAVRRLHSTAPVVTRGLRSLRLAAPATTRLLRRGVPFADELTPVLRRFGPQLRCVRPYAPEMAGLFSTWASWSKNYDADGHYGRILYVFGPTSLNSTPKVDLAAYTKLFGQRYAMPRPPGYNAGRPQFNPGCGITRDALDPSKDPEQR